MYTYDGSRILCRRCVEQDVPMAELAAYLDGYVRELPAHMRVSDEEYARRLSICAGCDKLMGYTCRLCGCYAQVRAAKRLNRCPMPYAPLWDVWEGDDELEMPPHK